ncbi:uncharacterized protein BROUX77_003914 [Berkeleyomyces rouxiae]|uniref:uncharacterized protein n=1 Tax=Berkeleyomyces rouxiae TaxID=2035830 RepID=UPI003B783AA5
MKTTAVSFRLLRQMAQQQPRSPTLRRCQLPTQRSPFSTSRIRASEKPQPADQPGFESLVDRAPTIMRTGQKHGIGLYLLAVIPFTAFCLGTWQVQRLGWKSDLIAKLEDRLLRPPLLLPLHVDPEAVSEFDFRRVYAKGRFRHDQEMLVGPRMRDGQQGFMVVTPLERDGENSTVLVNRGWIPHAKKDKKSRPDSLVQGEIMVEGLLREPWRKNTFTPDNRPERWEFYFPDVKQMAGLVGSQPIWIESTLIPDYLTFTDYENRGIPIGRAPEVNLRNTHAQYIVTWYSLAIATSIMLYMVAKKPVASNAQRRVKMTHQW